MQNDESKRKSVKRETDHIKPLQEEAAAVDMHLLRDLEKIMHKEAEGRRLGFESVMMEIDSSQQVSDPEVFQYLCENSDTIFNESSPPNQLLILKIYTKLFLRSREDLAQWKHSKKNFWYQLLIKYMESGKPAVREAAAEFFGTLFEMTDRTALLKLGVELAAKKNVQLCRAFYGIANGLFTRFDAWEEEFDGVLELVVKQISDVRPDIKNGATQLFKNLCVLNPEKAMGALKKPTDKFREEVQAYVAEKKNDPVYSAKFPKLNQSATVKKSGRKSHVQPKTDAFKSANPVSIVGQFNGEWTDRVLEIRKWNEKKEEIEVLLKAGWVGRLNEKDSYIHLLVMAKRLIEQNNAQLQMCGFRVVGMLAHGLRSHGKSLLKNMLFELVSRLKDKNANVTKAIQSALVEMFFVLKPEETFEELKLYNTTRNKDTRMQIIQTLRNWHHWVSEFPSQKHQLPFIIKATAEVCNAYYDDPDHEVKKATNDFVLEYLESLSLDVANLGLFMSQVKKDRIKNLPKWMSEKTGRRVSRSNSKPRPKEQAQAEEVRRSSGLANDSKRRQVGKEVSSKKHSGNEDRQVKKVYLPDEINREVESLVSPAIISKLNSSRADLRHDGLEELSRYLGSLSQSQVSPKLIKVVFGFLREKFDNFHDPHLVANKHFFEIFSGVAAREACLEELFLEFIPLFFNRMTDGKYEERLRHLLGIFRGSVSFGFFLSNAYSHFHIIRQNDKALEGFYSTVSEFVMDAQAFSFSDFKAVIPPGLNSKSAKAREAAQLLLQKVVPLIRTEQFREILGSVESENARIALEYSMGPLSVGWNEEKHSLKEVPETTNDRRCSRAVRNCGTTTEVKLKVVSVSRNKQSSKSVNNSRHMKDNSSNPSSMAHRPESTTRGQEGEIQAGIISSHPETRRLNVHRFVELIRTNPSLLSVTQIDRTFQTLKLRMMDANLSVVKYTIAEFTRLFKDMFASFRVIHKQLVSQCLDLLLHKNVG
jgi:hypothetical protein